MSIHQQMKISIYLYNLICVWLTHLFLEVFYFRKVSLIQFKHSNKLHVCLTIIWYYLLIAYSFLKIKLPPYGIIVMYGHWLLQRHPYYAVICYSCKNCVWWGERNFFSFYSSIFNALLFSCFYTRSKCVNFVFFFLLLMYV